MDNVFSGLSLVIVVATLIALLMRSIKQPLIIGHIATGIIVGPAVLHFIHSPNTFTTFSDIGITLLLFIIGLGLNPQVISEVGKVAGTVGISQTFLTAMVGWICGRLVGLDQVDSIFLGIALSFSSTIIILKLLADKKQQLRLYGKISTGVLLVQDMLAAMALLFLTAKGSSSVFSVGSVGYLAMKGIVVAYSMLLVRQHVIPRMKKLIAGSQEFLFLFAIGWGFGSAALFSAIGFSEEIGALYAGILLSSLPYSQEVASRLRPLRDFFIVLFFVTLGAGLNFGAVSKVLPAIIIGVVIAVIVKPLISLILMGLLGYTKRTSFKAATTLGQISEFSIVFIILGYKQGLISNELTTIITVVALISIGISSYAITYLDKLYQLLEKKLSFFEKNKTITEHDHQKKYDLILFGFQKGGHEFLRVFEQLKNPYIVIDYDPEMIDAMEHKKINYLYGDANDVELLEEAGLKSAKLVVSTITDHETSSFLLNYLETNNKSAVSICMSENPEKATKLYQLGASYVMLPHYIGSEKISAFIKRVGFKKSEFKKIRDKHIQYLEAQKNMMEVEPQNRPEKSIGHTILNAINSHKN